MPQDFSAADLDRVLQSPGFADAGRLGPFLRFLVERTQAGEAAQLKESVVGVEVFGRPPGYDPRTDPIVRVEARRLRQRLAAYYAGPGASDPVRIELPKGTYVPTFIGSAAQRRRSWGTAIAIGLPVLAAVAALFLVPRFWRPPLPQAEPTVAVLPFANVGNDPQNDYFSDGLTEELIDTLAQLDGVQVVGRGASFQFKGKQVDSREAGRRLSASNIVEGSVRRAGDRLRVTAQLVDAGTGYSLWSGAFDRDARDIFAIQSEIATAIANALKLKLSVLRGPALSRRYTENLEAYNLYLQAKYQWNRYTKDGLERALEYCDRALAADPRYAPAHALKATVYGLLGYYEMGPPDAWKLSKAAAERAISIDSSLAEAHAARGWVLGLAEWRWQDCENAFKRALALNALSGEVHGAYALGCLMPQGRFEEANRGFRRALELDPLATFINYGYGFSLLASGQVDAAVKQYAKTLELAQTTSDMWWDYAMALAMAGRKDEARKAWEKAAEVAGRPAIIGVAGVAMLGEVEKARQIMRSWETETAGERVEEPMDRARDHALIGETNKAVAWVERAFSERDPQVVWLKVDPRLRNIQSDPRIIDIKRRIGL
jgi:serine/threonine-protein kinase